MFKILNTIQEEGYEWTSPILPNTEGFSFFWGNGETFPTFSNWHPSPFSLLNGMLNFESGEHYMMIQKALLFEDYGIMEKMSLVKDDPRKLKKLGRKVSGFDQEQWESTCINIITLGLYFKFIQNKECLEQLLSTGNTMIVEASPNDKVWGIGMHTTNEGIDDPANWPSDAKNLLGICLTRVRELIRKELAQ